MFSKRELCVGAAAVMGASVLPVTSQAAGAVVRIPISFSPSGMPLIKISIAGKGPYNFLVDTGAFAAIIREPLAKELGLKQGGSIKSLSLGGKSNDYIYQARDLIIGGGFRFAKMDMVGLDGFAAKGIDGVLPASFLTAVPTQLDYEASEIRYYLDGAQMDLTGFEKVPAFYHSDRTGGTAKVYVEVVLEGKKLVCCVDTGASSTLVLSGAIVDRRKLWDKYKVLREGKSRGANGKTVNTRLVLATDLSIGTVRIEKMPITLCDPNDGDTIDQLGMDGLLGTAFLRRFVVAFNGKQDLYFKANGSFAALSQTIPEGMLAKPAQSVAGTSVVPFLYGEPRKIILPVKSGDKTALSFLLATDRAVSAIKPLRAKELGLPVLSEGRFDGGALEFASGGKMLPLSLMARDEKLYGFDAVLGLDFLLSKPCQIDFDTRLLTLFDEATPDLTGFTKIPAVRKSLDPAGQSRYYLSARLQDADALFLVDTTMQMGVWLPPHVVKARGLWDGFADAEPRLLTEEDGRRTKARYVKMKGLEFGGFRIDPAPVTLSDPTTDTYPETHGFDGVIGMGVLHRFTIVFDKAGDIWVKPNSRFV